jgi:hypothetical protein
MKVKGYEIEPQANLRDANLSGANLRDADLRDADLSRANLSYADLRGANLSGADLRDANLRSSDLFGAHLSYTNLIDADLRGANLHGADLRGAYLSGADLFGAHLSYTNLSGADLRETVLDCMRIPNGDVEGFRLDGGWCHGYRTKKSQHVGDTTYNVGEVYTAPVFSTGITECHPGIFVLPTENEARQWDGTKHGIVEVIFRPWDCHRAVEKWRVTELIVWKDIKEESK